MSSTIGIPSGGSKPVSVSYHDQQIGKGNSTASATLVEVSGIYDIPPTIAEVDFSFAVHLLDDRRCSVAANLPDLLPGNPLNLEGSYLVVLTLGRAGLLISAGEYRIGVTFTGPISQPNIVTGFQLGITGPDAAVTLGFVYL
jgi:hypothetical protein